MTTKNSPGKDFEALDNAIDIYGADTSRWPAHVSRALAPLLAGSADAQKRMREAGVFERMLDSAPVMSKTRQAALADRIVAAAGRQPRIVHGTAAPQLRATDRVIGRREHGFAAAALAASLMLGIVAGGRASIIPFAATIVSDASGDAGASSQRLAAMDDADGLFYEDLL